MFFELRLFEAMLFRHLVLTFAIIGAPAAFASDDRPVVVELFSSQNCAACPDANQNLTDLAEERNIIPLTWSVDYWDYLASDDPNARPEFTERQMAYAERFNLRGPYTPQTVYDGTKQCPARKKSRMERNVNASLDRHTYSATIDLTASGSTKVDATITGSTDVSVRQNVWLVHFDPGITVVAPSSGDNAGKVMPYKNMVTHLERLDSWSGGEMSLSFECASGCAVMVQAEDMGPIAAAASIVMAVSE